MDILAKAALIKPRVCTLALAALAGTMDAWINITAMYYRSYNHISSRVLFKNGIYGVITCYRFSSDFQRVKKSILVNQGWFVWLAFLYALHFGMRLNISSFLTRYPRCDGRCHDATTSVVYELIRGKSRDCEIILTRHMMTVLPCSTNNQTRIISASADALQGDMSISFTMFMRERVRSFNKNNNLTANEVILMGALHARLDTSSFDVAEYKLNVFVERPQSSHVAPHQMFEELQFSGSECVIIL